MSEPFKQSTDKSAAQRLDTFFLGFLILAMCSQIDPLTVGRDTLAEGLGYATKTLKIALSDIALLLCFGWFVAHTTMQRSWRKLWWPPLPCWALIVAMTVSLLHSPHVIEAVTDALSKANGPKDFIRSVAAKESKEAIAEVVQFGAYFIIAPLLFVNLMHDRRFVVLIERRRFALHVFSGAVLLNVLAATWQLVSFADSAPRGLFGSPNIYSVFLAISLPLLIALELHREKHIVPPLVVTIITVALGITTLTSVWIMAAIIIGVIVAGWMQRRFVRSLRVVAVMLLASILAWNMQSKLKPNRAENWRVASATQKVKKQYIEWYAALGWAVPKGQELPLGVAQLHQFETGVAPGNYQQNIGPLYSSLPNEEKMPPDSNNLYLVQAVSIGALGLGALLWVFAHFICLTKSVTRRRPKDWLAFGVYASLLSWLIVNLFHAGIVRGGGVVLAFVLSLAVVAASHATQSTQELSSEEINSEKI